MPRLSDSERIQYIEVPELWREISKLKSDNEYLIEKIVELEEKILKYEKENEI